MQRANQRARPAETPARLIVWDTARELRDRLRASRRLVDKNVDEIAGRRRGVTVADGLAFLAAEMLSGGICEQEVTARIARMGGDIVATEAAKRRA